MVMDCCRLSVRKGSQKRMNEQGKRPEAPIRMIGLDLDGTVFNNEKRITQHTCQVLRQAIDQGVVVLPATGRPQVGLPPQFLEIPGVRYALTANGAKILDLEQKTVVYEQPVPWDLALEAIGEMDRFSRACWEVYHDGHIYVDADTYQFVRHPDMAPALLDYIRKSRTFFSGLRETIRRQQWKIEKLHMMFEDTEERDLAISLLQEKFPGLSVSCATTFNVEIVSAKAGKGNGLLALGKLLGISREEIMACGDARNDWDMLKKVGFPVVMGNADEETRKLAAYVTRTNEEDGVAWAIEKFVLKRQTMDIEGEDREAVKDAEKFTFRKACREDLDGILAVMEDARRSMEADGFHQWINGYPAAGDIIRDMEKGAGYVVREKEGIAAYAALLFGEDPHYRDIYQERAEAPQSSQGGQSVRKCRGASPENPDGSARGLVKTEWPDQLPYGTIHRIAVTSRRKCRGIAGGMLKEMEEICRRAGITRMRVDTHRDNRKMQAWIQKHGFSYCGIVFMEDGSRRNAYIKRLD